MRRRTDFLTLEASFVIRRHAFYILRRFEAIKCASKTNCFVCTSFMWIHRKSFVSAKTNATATRGIIDANAKIVAPNVAAFVNAEWTVLRHRQLNCRTCWVIARLHDRWPMPSGNSYIQIIPREKFIVYSLALSSPAQLFQTEMSNGIQWRRDLYVISSSASRRSCRDAKWWTNINL